MRTVFVTGASGGIGAAVAAAFAAEGDRVVLGCYSKPGAALASAKALHAAVVQGDVAVPADVERMFGEIEKQFGHVDVLVNGAGHAQQKMLVDITPDEWDRMMAVHAKGSFLCAKRALPGMVRRRQGSIVNIASMWGQVGASCEVHYSAAKAAVIGFTKALAKEVALSGIRVNCVAPGAVSTSMLAGFTADELQAVCDETPMGRLGTAEEVAAAVVFLASAQAGFITGQVLAPNGGYVV